MKLKIETVDNVLREAHAKLHMIDAHAGLIAECESLGEQLNAAGERNGVRFHTSVLPGTDSLHVWLQVNYRSRSAIYAAIQAAGIEFAGESNATTDGYIQIHLEGFDVPIFAGNIAAELAEAA